MQKKKGEEMFSAEPRTHKIVEFPRDFPLFRERECDVKIIGSTSRETLASLPAGSNPFFTMMFIRESEPFYLLIGGMDVFNSPELSQSSTSGALYYAAKVFETDGFLLQYLPPNEHTSQHFHKETRETFFVLKGVVLLRVDGGELVLREGQQYALREGRVHRLRTSGSGSLVLIHMQGRARGLTKDDHFYEEN